MSSPSQTPPALPPPSAPSLAPTSSSITTPATTIPATSSEPGSRTSAQEPENPLIPGTEPHNDLAADEATSNGQSTAGEGSEASAEAETLEAKARREQEEKMRRRIASLHSQIKSTDSKIEEARRGIEEGKGKLKNPDPEATIAHHIKLLHDYNAIRDIGTGLFGIIAERRGVRVREVFEEYGLSEGD